MLVFQVEELLQPGALTRTRLIKRTQVQQCIEATPLFPVEITRMPAQNSNYMPWM